MPQCGGREGAWRAALADELLASGFQASTGTPEQRTPYIKSELPSAKIARRSGVKAE